jgi:nucleoside-diphosphate-sugar epimerase
MADVLVFVTGGTGAIGGHAVPALTSAGHQVSALVRSRAKAGQLRQQGATPVEVSLFDAKGLTEAFAGHDAVINLATAIPPMRQFMNARAWAANQRVRAEGSAAVVDAALAAGVGRVVQESVVMLYADGRDTWLDEDAPVERYPMAEGNLAAEANTRRFTGHGRTGVVLRFGWFYGPGAAHSEQMLAMARRHIVMTLGHPGSYQSSIHMADAGAAVAAAVEVPAGVYNVVDDQPLTKREYAGALAAAAGVTPWIRGPGRAAMLFGNRLTSLTRSVRATNSRFKAASGWAPGYPSAREGWMATAAVRS